MMEIPASASSRASSALLNFGKPKVAMPMVGVRSGVGVGPSAARLATGNEKAPARPVFSAARRLMSGVFKAISLVTRPRQARLKG